MRTPKNFDLWLPGYLRSISRRRFRPDRSNPCHVLLCVADHFEPRHGQPGLQQEAERVTRWRAGMRALSARFADSDGCPPKHTFFFPAEEYHPSHLDTLAEIGAAGHGEVEVHLHHDGDTSAHLEGTLRQFCDTLASRHGLLARDPSGGIAYAFVHGNWALDNSNPTGRWCGVNDELSVLLRTGCFADLTMPSAPDGCQTRTVNSIYYAVDDPDAPKSHDVGTPAAVGVPRPNESLLMIQGPLSLDWRRRKWGGIPRLENAALDSTNPPSLERFFLWLRCSPEVVGRPDWIFVKLHAHGATEPEAAVLLGDPMQSFLRSLATWLASHPEYRVHFVTAREMANLVKAAEDGMTGNPHDYRDYCYRSRGAVFPPTSSAA